MDAQILELTPSLLGTATLVQPQVTVADGALSFFRARAWRDADFEAQAAANLCVHLIVASINDKPASFSLSIDGLCRSKADDCIKSGLNASHLFTEFYSVPVTKVKTSGANGGDGAGGSGGGGGHAITDVLMPGSTAVYAIGCESYKATPTNLVRRSST